MKSSIIAAIGIVIIIVVIGAVLLAAGGKRSGTGSNSPNIPYNASTNSSSSSSGAGAYGATNATNAVNNTGTTSNLTNSSTATAPTNSTNSTTSGVYAAKIGDNSTYGNYLETGSGWTLYVYTPDTPGSGMSACYGSCDVYWPPFYNASSSFGSGLNVSAFGVINRTGGTMQLTYYGWPLYTYAGDRAPGQINGEGVSGTWYIISPNGTMIT